MEGSSSADDVTQDVGGAGDEELLATGGVTEVVRVAGTVRRTPRPSTASVHALLRHVRTRGFLEVPQPLGWDDRGREVLSYVEGDVPDDPLPAEATTVEVLGSLARLVRRLHDAVADFVPPADARWGAGEDHVARSEFKVFGEV